MQVLYSFVVRLVRGLLTIIPLSIKKKQFVEEENTFGMTLKIQTTNQLSGCTVAWRV